jgi:SRSO17 transposase
MLSAIAAEIITELINEGFNIELVLADSGSPKQVRMRCSDG